MFIYAQVTMYICFGCYILGRHIVIEFNSIRSIRELRRTFLSESFTKRFFVELIKFEFELNFKESYFHFSVTS